MHATVWLATLLGWLLVQLATPVKCLWSFICIFSFFIMPRSSVVCVSWDAVVEWIFKNDYFHCKVICLVDMWCASAMATMRAWRSPEPRRTKRSRGRWIISGACPGWLSVKWTAGQSWKCHFTSEIIQQLILRDILQHRLGCHGQVLNILFRTEYSFSQAHISS